MDALPMMLDHKLYASVRSIMLRYSVITFLFLIFGLPLDVNLERSGKSCLYTVGIKNNT